MALTDNQRAALWEADGKPTKTRRIVSARPGTGKTTTLTQYCIALAEEWSEQFEPWQGMAAISYTNVAKDELERKIKDLGKANSLLTSPHFVGTIDSFLNQYLFLPFGASQMGASTRPKLVGEPYAIWRPTRQMIQGKPTNAYDPMFFDCYTLSSNGQPLLTDTTPRKRGVFTRSAEKVTASNPAKILELKQYIWQQGYAVQNDANYFAYKTLLDSPELTSYFIRRFPVLIIDEAQDMTEVQHALLDHLKQAGQEHMVLIGDEYQAIYEWNTARPQLFVDKGNDPDWNAKTISETFRCSSNICSVLTKLASDGNSLAPASGGKNHGYTETVKVVEYDTDTAQQAEDTKAAIREVATLLAGKQPHDDNEDGIKTIAVLGRSSADADQLQACFSGETPSSNSYIVWEDKMTKDYLRVVHILLRKDYYKAFRAYESLLYNRGDYENKAVMQSALNAVWNPEDPTTIAYRKSIYADLLAISNSLPSQEDVAISECVNFCNFQPKCLDTASLQSIKNDCQAFSSARSQQDKAISALFNSREERIVFRHPDVPDVKIIFSTVHGVKGETYDGVLFFTKTMTSSCTCNPAKKKWVDILQHSLIVCENKRIAYVALSRAAQVLHIMAPIQSKASWEALL